MLRAQAIAPEHVDLFLAMRDNSNSLLEHRLVMAIRLGRALAEDENVHHKNGDRGDNRDENLELWLTPQPPGQRAEDQVRWARALLARYGDLFPAG